MVVTAVLALSVLAAPSAFLAADEGQAGSVGAYTTPETTGPVRSIAVEDGFSALFANPAAIGVGNGEGLALSYRYPLAGAQGPESFEEFLDGLTLYSNGFGSDYAYRRRGDRNLHDIGIGFETAPNLYVGAAAGLADFDFANIGYRGGVLYRPLDYLSVGAVVRGTSAGDLAGGAGLGLRPLAFSDDLEDVLTLDGQVHYSGEAGLSFPRVGVSIHAPRGVTLEGSVDPESGRFGIGASLSYGSLRSGATYYGATETTEGDGAAEEGVRSYVHISPKRFPTIGSFQRGYVAEYAPGPSIVERSGPVGLASFTEIGGQAALPEVLDQIERLKDDPRVEGILFRNHRLQISFANLQELQTALREFKDAGKTVAFYYNGVGNLNYAFAAGVADAVYLHPQGSVNLVGLGTAQPYVGDLLDRVGIGISNIRSHPAKSTYNFLSESEQSEAERENLETLYDGLYEEFVGMIEEGRGDRLSGSAREVIDGGPYLTADAALEAGLVDELLHPDEVDDAVAELNDGAEPSEARFSRSIETSWSNGPTHKVAIIYGIGNIATGEGQPGSSIGSESMARAIRSAREDRSIDAILLRIDSGGGSSLASDIIAREVAKTTEGENAKPVVVSMAATAASGGYYIAAPADHIVAQASTVTGSIGVVALAFNVAELSERYDVNWESVLRGENADFAAIYRELSEEERSRILDGMLDTYDTFVQTVAEGREMAENEVDAVARGRVWTGTQARERGLVDTVGGLQTAVEVLRDTLPGDRDLEFEEFTGVDDPFESLTAFGLLPLVLERMGLTADPTAQLPAELREIVTLQEELAAYGQERFIMRAPEDLAPRSE
jgi:protease-4